MGVLKGDPFGDLRVSLFNPGFTAVAYIIIPSPEVRFPFGILRGKGTVNDLLDCRTSIAPKFIYFCLC